jgi:hypothetical protein
LSKVDDNYIIYEFRKDGFADVTLDDGRAVAEGPSLSSLLGGAELVPLIVEKDGGSSPRTLQSGEAIFPLKGGDHHVPEKLPEEHEARQVADPLRRAA